MFGFKIRTVMSFEIHIKTVLTNLNKTIGLLKKFRQILSVTSLITKYKTFRRPHLDYADIVFDQALNNFFYQRLQPIQYNAALAITGCI